MWQGLTVWVLLITLQRLIQLQCKEYFPEV